MEGIILDGISDVKSDYGTPNLDVEGLLTGIDNDLKSSNIKKNKSGK